MRSLVALGLVALLLVTGVHGMEKEQQQGGGGGKQPDRIGQELLSAFERANLPSNVMLMILYEYVVTVHAEIAQLDGQAHQADADRLGTGVLSTAHAWPRTLTHINALLREVKTAETFQQRHLLALKKAVKADLKAGDSPHIRQQLLSLMTMLKEYKRIYVAKKDKPAVAVQPLPLPSNAGPSGQQQKAEDKAAVVDPLDTSSYFSLLPKEAVLHIIYMTAEAVYHELDNLEWARHAAEVTQRGKNPLGENVVNSESHHQLERLLRRVKPEAFTVKHLEELEEALAEDIKYEENEHIRRHLLSMQHMCSVFRNVAGLPRSRHGGAPPAQEQRKEQHKEQRKEQRKERKEKKEKKEKKEPKPQKLPKPAQQQQEAQPQQAKPQQPMQQQQQKPQEQKKQEQKREEKDAEDDDDDDEEEVIDEDDEEGDEAL